MSTTYRFKLLELSVEKLLPASFIAGCTVAVQLAAVWLAGGWGESGTTPGQANTGVSPGAFGNPESATSILGLFGTLAVDLIVFLALLIVYKWLSPPWRRVMRVGVLLAAGAWLIGISLTAHPGVAALLVASAGLYALRFEWIGMDVAGLTVGAFAAAIIGQSFHPKVLIALLMVMVAIDVIAVDSGLMGKLAVKLLAARVPAVVVLPRRFDLRWSVVVDALKAGEKPEGARLLIGVGDFAFPAALAASVAVYYHAPTALGVSMLTWWVLAGTLAGVVLLSASVGDGKAHPGLPYLATGALAGFVGAFLWV